MFIVNCFICAFAVLVGFSVKSQILQQQQFVTLHKWTNLTLDFATEAERKTARSRVVYGQSKALPVDLDIEYGDDGYHRTFLTIPRLGAGIPFSLAVVADSDNATVLNPKLLPYPHYEWHSSYGSDCSNITSAMRIFIDECWRLWVVDSGQINSLQFCPPQILAFDLVTDSLVHRFAIPSRLYVPGVSVFTALTVDVGDAEPQNECRDTMVYIADPWGYGLIVHDAQAMKAWRIEHDLMHPDEKLRKLNSAHDGIFTVSISPKRNTGGARQLYFHALNSYKEVSISLDIVHNGSIWSANSRSAADEFLVIGSRGTQCESEAMDSAGNLYCSLISATALIKWKEGTAYNSDNLQVVAYSPSQLKFVTGLKINRNSLEEDELWILSNDPKLFVGGQLKTEEIKFQIVGCRTSNLLTATKCTVSARDK